jgi:hypothetical protein
MKPSNSKRRITKTPSPEAIRYQLLSRIREAKFPTDADKFTESELREAGLWEKYTRPEDMGGKSFKLLVLLATQARELRRERDNLRREIDELEDYRSPHRDKLRDEPDPLKRQEITRQAEADEARVAQERAAKKQSFHDAFLKFFGQRPWLRRDASHTPYEPVYWHEPMTVMDYHEATGLTRRTILNILHRLGAKPLAKRERINAPAKYGVETNFAILREWLVRYEKQPGNRRAWLVRTLLKYKHDSPEHFKDLIQAILPVLESLGINTEEKIKEFRAYVLQCEPILYPPPQPDPFLDALLGLSPEISVGKNG